MPRKISEKEKQLIEKINQACPLVDPNEKDATKLFTDEEFMESIYDYNKNGEDWIVLYATDMNEALKKITHIEDTYFTPNTEANRDFGLTMMSGEYRGTHVFTLKKKRISLEQLKKDLGDKVSIFRTNFIVPQPSNMLFKLVKDIVQSFVDVETARNEKTN